MKMWKISNKIKLLDIQTNNSKYAHGNNNKFGKMPCKCISHEKKMMSSYKFRLIKYTVKKS